MATPINNTVYAVNRLPLIFNVTTPQSTTAVSTIVQTVTYQADWMDKTVDVFMGGQEQVSLSLQLSNIPEGNHSIIIQTLGSGLYDEGSSYKEFRISSSSEIKFKIDTTIPIISLQQIENVSLKEGIPLVFMVNEPISEVTYVIDNQQNITIQGNATIPYLPAGKHNVTSIFASDLAGNFRQIRSNFLCSSATRTH